MNSLIVFQNSPKVGFFWKYGAKTDSLGPLMRSLIDFVGEWDI